jgi:hypothetical protein
MRPSVSVLLSWQPAALGSAGDALLTRAADLQRSAGDLTSIGSGLSAVWSGAAAQAATAHHTRRSAEVDDLGTVVHTAGQALLRAAEAIGQARTSLQSALAAASAAGCTVLDDGTVLPPARPPVPGGLTDEDRTAWQTEADATAAAQAGVAARLEAQIRSALTAAGAADDVSAAALAALQPPTVSPAPQPVAMGLTGGQWGPMALPSCPTTPTTPATTDDGNWWDGTVEQLGGFADGVRDGVVEPVKMVGGLVGLNGDTSDNWSDLGQGLEHGVTHPADFGKALIGWDDLSAGRYGHWAGELVPGIAAAFATGGAAAGLKGADAAAATARAGQVLRNARAGLDDRLASGGLARDAGVLNPVAPARSPLAAAWRTPEARQQWVDTQLSPANPNRRDTVTGGEPGAYQRRVAGPDEVLLNPDLDKQAIWADGISLDPDMVVAVEAKYVVEPGPQSMYEGAGRRPRAVQEMLMRNFDTEMHRYGLALADPATPVGRLRIVTNTDAAAQYLGERARTLLPHADVQIVVTP